MALLLHKWVFLLIKVKQTKGFGHRPSLASQRRLHSDLASFGATACWDPLWQEEC